MYVVCDSSKPDVVQIGQLCVASLEQVYDVSSEQLCTLQRFTKYYTEN
jgi:hypothetical protein